MVAISVDPTKTSFDFYTSQTEALFSGVTVDDPRTLSWDAIAGGAGIISITFKAPADYDQGTLLDPLAKDSNQFTETDGPDNTVTYTEQATVTPGANSAPTDILDRLIYIAPPTTGQAAYDIQASVSYSGTELDAPGYPTPSVVKPVTVALDKPVVAHFSPVADKQYPDLSPMPTAPSSPIPTPGPQTPSHPVTIGVSAPNPVYVTGSGGTGQPFSIYSIDDTVHQTWDRLYGGNGMVTITLHPVSGLTGTITDDGTGVAKASGAVNAAGDYVFTEQAVQGSTAPVTTPDDILDRLIYHAPQVSQTTDIYATVSYTTQVALDGTYPTPTQVTTQTITSPDKLDLSVRTPNDLGPPYTGPLPGSPVPLPPPVIVQPQPTPIPAPIINVTINNFLFVNSTSGQSGAIPGESYTGPVGGLINQLIQVTADSLAISATAPNSFIHTGSGDDAIDVSAVSGNNVLDGGTGSNFLVGGAGLDTFFLDARNAAASIWSTVGNFHSGDAATLWGLTAQSFQYAWADGQGAAGHEGLTLHATGNGVQPEASLTLAGYSTADLSNGRLAMVFGHNDGGDYLYIHAA